LIWLNACRAAAAYLMTKLLEVSHARRGVNGLCNRGRSSDAGDTASRRAARGAGSAAAAPDGDTRMIAVRPAAAVVLMLLAGATAHAGDAGDVASRGGFLLGQALRCGVAEHRLEPSAKLVHDLVVALAATDDELHDADRSFAARLLASAQPGKGEPAPSCKLILRKLAVLQRHHAGGGVALQAGLGHAGGYLPVRPASVRRDGDLL
jgi:hypothetical protein